MRFGRDNRRWASVIELGALEECRSESCINTGNLPHRICTDNYRCALSSAFLYYQIFKSDKMNERHQIHRCASTMPDAGAWFAAIKEKFNPAQVS